MAEPTTADTWIYSKLAADTTLTALIGGASAPRIYRNLTKPPASTRYPCVLIRFSDGEDVRGTGTTNIMAQGMWIVKGIDKNTSASTVATIAGRIYTDLHGIASGSVLQCTREEPIAYSEEVDGILYQHQGGMYQIFVQ